MEINKEREAFEAEFSKIKSDISFWLHTWDEEMQGYNHPVMCWFWHMWQAAKATPEGFVLVPKECPDPFFADNLFADLKTRSFICDGEEFINLCDIDPIVVWKMVIEAQEQSHE